MSSQAPQLQLQLEGVFDQATPPDLVVTFA
jgi:hypothetical protein